MKNINSIILILKNSHVPKKYYFKLIIYILYLAGFNVIFSYFLQIGINISTGTNQWNSFILFAVAFISSCLLFAITAYKSGVIQEKIIQISAKNLKSKMLSEVIDIPTLEVQKLKSGDLLTWLTDDCDNCSRYICYSVIPVVQLLLSIIFGLIYVILNSIVLGIIAIVFSLIVYYINKLYSKKMESIYCEIQEKEGKLRTFFTEFYDNGSIIKVFDLHKKLHKKFNKINEEKSDNIIKNAKYLGAMSTITEAIVLIVEFLILLLGIYLQKSELISLSVLFGIWNVTIGSIIYPATELPEISANLSMQNASFKRIKYILTHTSNEDLENNPKLLKGIFNVSSLSFEYVKGDNVLNDISFTCKAKDIIYITGNSGCGKSTLIKNLVGLYSQNKGSIYISENDLIDENYKGYISYIPQANSMFSMSIMDNIKMGNLEINNEELFQYSKELGIDEFVQKLPLKYETILGTDFRLSEGQSQRISILRGIMRQSNVLIFDEPFSAQDPIHCKLIMNTIKKIAENRGCIIVSHIKQSIQIATKVYQLDGGVLYEKK